MNSLKRTMPSVSLLGILICLSLAVAELALGQTSNAQVTGLVTDSSGASIPGASVKVVNTATNVTVQAQTNPAGVYVITQLIPGVYRITVSNAGFKSVEQPNVVLRISDRVSVNFTLEIGEIQTQITVSADATLLTTGDATISNVVDNKLITQLPQLGRSTLDLTKVTPSIQGSGPVKLGTGNDYMVGLRGATYSLAGGQPNGSIIAVDGATMNEGDSNVINGAIPTPDSVGEFRVQTGVLTADTGRYSGGVVSISTLSGTNAFHGKIFEYYRNQSMNANSWYNNNHELEKDIRHQNNFGAAVGGPVWIPKIYNGRNRTFFFFGYEGERYKTGNTARSNVPTEEERNGIFTNSIWHWDDNGNPVPMRIFDPFRGNMDGNGNWVRPEFPNAVIPEQYWSEVGKNYLNLYPKPNHEPLFNTSNQENYWSQTTYSRPNDRISLRIDENFTGAHRLNFRLSRSSSSSATTAPYKYGARDSSTDLNWSGALQYVWTASPTSIVEFRAGLTHANLYIVTGSEADDGIDSDNFGFDPQLFATGNRKDKHILPYLYNWWGTFGTLGGSYADRITSQNFNADAAYTKIWGRHTLRAGFQYYQTRLSEDGGDLSGVDRVYPGGGSNELWNEDNNTGYELAEILLGSANAYTYGLFNVSPFMNSYAGYLMDDWKVNNKLTVQIGLRIDHDGSKRVRYPHTGVVWDFDAKNVMKPNADWSWNQVLAAVPELGNYAQPGWLSTGVNGRASLRDTQEYPGDVIFTTNKAVWQPRLGISYALNPKTVIRASGGIIYQGLNGLSFDDSGNCYYGRDIFNQTSTQDGMRWVSEIGLERGLGAFPLQPDGSNLGYIPSLKTNADYWRQTYGAMPSPATGVAQLFGPKMDSPQEYTWTASLQREIGRSWVASAEYIGIRGIHMVQPVSSYMFTNTTTPYYGLQSKLYDPVPNPFYGQSAAFSGQSTIPLYHLLSTMPQYDSAGIRMATWGYMKAHYLNLQIQSRGYHGLSLLASYTIRKTLTTSGAKDSRNGGPFTGGNSVQNPYDIDEVYGVATYETPQAWLFNYMYELPIGRGKALLGSPSSLGGKVLDQFVGGWALAGTTNFWPKGTPIRAPGVPNKNAAPGTAIRYSVKSGVSFINPNFDPESALLVDGKFVSSNPQIRFDHDAYLRTPDYTMGNLPQYYSNVRQPGGFATDATVMKNFYFDESRERYLNIRVEAINFFNHPNYGSINATPHSVAFGGVNGKSGNRIMQIGARIFF
jgi:hypothetical protein